MDEPTRTLSTAPAELSGFDAGTTAPLRARRAPHDACQSAFALRALLLVQAVLLCALALAADAPRDALAQLGPLIGAGLLGSGLWLGGVCVSATQTERRSDGARWAVRLALGAAAALLAALPFLVLGLWPADALRLAGLPLAGALLALPLTAWLEARRRSRAPADARARLAELQSRIRPHFLFNALNSAIALVRVDPARAEGVLEDLAELFRVALAAPGSAVTLADELELARRYLAIEQVRFGDRLRLEWQLDAAADGARVPPLLLQPLVENAVRHGVETDARGGTIRVRTACRLGEAVITIDNTVRGASSAGHGIALANVRERLRLMHDLAAQFDVRSRDGWHRVRIVVPLEGAR